MNEQLSLKNDQKYKNFEELESTIVAHTMPKTTISFCAFSSLSAGILAIAYYRKGSGDNIKSLNKLFSSCLKLPKQHPTSSTSFSIVDFQNNVRFLPVTAAYT